MKFSTNSPSPDWFDCPQCGMYKYTKKAELVVAGSALDGICSEFEGNYTRAGVPRVSHRIPAPRW